MKTTLYLQRPAPAPFRAVVRPSIVRLGLVVSAVAAVVVIALEVVTDVPVALAVVPVVVVGAALSWHASGRPERPASD